MLIYDILEALGDLIKDKEEAKTVIDDLLSNFVIDVWHSDDILSCAMDNNIIINNKEASDILDNIRHSHNADDGITWDYIEGEIEYYVEDRKDEKYVLRVGEKKEV